MGRKTMEMLTKNLEFRKNNGRDESGRHRLSDVVPLNMPYNIQIEPSDICNFRCEYCAHATDRMTATSMEWETFEKIVSDLKEMSDSLNIINIIGYGEPLVYDRISDMVSMIKDAGLSNRIEITTNASLLTHEMSDKLIRAGLTRLIVSLQGLNAEKYKRICGYNIDFDRFVDNIRYFYKNRGVLVGFT